MNVKIAPSWKSLLEDEFEKPYFITLAHSLKQLKAQGKTIYPPGPLIFKAFDHTPVDKVKVVVIGQDPYHGPGEAMGLSFSVPKGVRIPPSLKNIFKEIQDDIGSDLPSHGDLTSWADQGVFLLNAILTVEHKNAGSHKNLGWHLFTDAVITKLSRQRQGLVFMLWGNFARSKKELISKENGHLILEAPHPSPLARGGFFGCKHFSKANDFFAQKSLPIIDWSIT